MDITLGKKSPNFLQITRVYFFLNVLWLRQLSDQISLNLVELEQELCRGSFCCLKETLDLGVR